MHGTIGTFKVVVATSIAACVGPSARVRTNPTPPAAPRVVADVESADSSSTVDASATVDDPTAWPTLPPTRETSGLERAAGGTPRPRMTCTPRERAKTRRATTAPRTPQSAVCARASRASRAANAGSVQTGGSAPDAQRAGVAAPGVCAPREDGAPRPTVGDAGHPPRVRRAGRPRRLAG